jgi:hypothetical protein
MTSIDHLYGWYNNSRTVIVKTKRCLSGRILLATFGAQGRLVIQSINVAAYVDSGSIGWSSAFGKRPLSSSAQRFSPDMLEREQWDVQLSLKQLA